MISGTIAIANMSPFGFVLYFFFSQYVCVLKPFQYRHNVYIDRYRYRYMCNVEVEEGMIYIFGVGVM